MVDRYVDAFLLARRAQVVMPKTIEWHAGAIRLFVAWLRAEGLPEDPGEWDAALFRRYVVHLQERPTMRGGKRDGTLRPGTVTDYVQSLLAFTRWLADEEFTDRNVAAKVEKPTAPQLVQQPLADDEIARLVNAAKADRRNGLRDLAILYLLLDSGLRASEPVGLKADDILWEQRLVKVFGKGRKERIVPFGPTTAAAMRKYDLKARKPGGAAEFFQTEEGRPLEPMGRHYLLKRLAPRTGIDGEAVRLAVGIDEVRAGLTERPSDAGG